MEPDVGPTTFIISHCTRPSGVSKENSSQAERHRRNKIEMQDIFFMFAWLFPNKRTNSVPHNAFTYR